MKKELTCNHSETRVCVNCWQPTGISGVSEKDTEKMIETNELSRPTSQEKIDYSTDGFIKEFMNDHNGYPPRWLRGIFFSEKEKIETILKYMREIELSSSATIASERSSIARELTEKIKDERDICRKIFINECDWSEWGMSEKDAGERFDAVRTEMLNRINK